MTVNDKSKDIIVKLINYFTTNQILGITYAEAIDADTVAHLNITLTNSLPDGDSNIPAKRISLLKCNESDKTIIQDVLTFLSEENTTGFDYNMDVPGMEQKIFIHVELKQITTK